ncbi:MAG: hypothetical protein ACI9AD_000501 [Nitriliruptoraceae bacterium]|jgi:hypothetical protein
MRRPSLCTVTPWLLASGLLLASCGADQIPSVDADPLNATATETATSGPSDAPTAIASDAVTAVVDASTETPEVCVGREDEAFIVLLAPADSADVGTSFTLEGCGNTFEATWLWRVTLADDTVAGEGFGTMSCGSGCVGTFAEEVAVIGSGAAVLRVWESSPEDGSELHVTEVAITIS